MYRSSTSVYYKCDNILLTFLYVGYSIHAPLHGQWDSISLVLMLMLITFILLYSPLSGRLTV